jgi:hypothetical protein
VDEKGCKSFDEFKSAVLTQMQNVPHGILKSYFSSMKDRMMKAIAAEGDKIKY